LAQKSKGFFEICKGFDLGSGNYYSIKMR